MGSSIVRTLNLCFTKLKQRPPTHPSPDPLPPTSSNSISIHNPNSNSILIKNYNSLYDPSLDHHPSTSTANATATSTIPDSESETATPDLTTVFASQRFFFSSPGRSNSITESSSSSLYSSSSLSPESDALLGGSVPIPTFSPDPYIDFRRSMQEMVEARDLIDVRANWDNLHELLMCYLVLNPKSTHKFIVGAFSDLLVTLMALPVDGGQCQRS